MLEEKYVWENVWQDYLIIYYIAVRVVNGNKVLSILGDLKIPLCVKRATNMSILLSWTTNVNGQIPLQ